jgi:hypothetical protein
MFCKLSSRIIGFVVAMAVVLPAVLNSGAVHVALADEEPKSCN